MHNSQLPTNLLRFLHLPSFSLPLPALNTSPCQNQLLPIIKAALWDFQTWGFGKFILIIHLSLPLHHHLPHCTLTCWGNIKLPSMLDILLVDVMSLLVVIPTSPHSVGCRNGFFGCVYWYFYPVGLDSSGASSVHPPAIIVNSSFSPCYASILVILDNHLDWLLVHLLSICVCSTLGCWLICTLNFNFRCFIDSDSFFLSYLFSHISDYFFL